jgi:hypothetical protein
LAEATGQGKSVRVRRCSSSDVKAFVATGCGNLGGFEDRCLADDSTLENEGLDVLKVPSGDVKDEAEY